jgi:cytosine/adenosine deaminase-related metal-dependent hydrolase
MTEVYRARWVLPIEGSPIGTGAIAVENGRIRAVGTAAQVTGDRVEDLGDCILLPGFVNAHTHLELSCYRGRIAPTDLWHWFEQLVKLIYLPGGPKPSKESVVAGAAESLAAGVTCVGDISRTGLHVEAPQCSPIRKVYFLELISGAILPPKDVPSLTRALDDAMQLVDGDRLRIGLSPHTLYTVTWQDLLGTAELAARREVPLTLHLAETREELQWLADGSGYLAELLDRWRLPCRGSVVRGTPLGLLESAGILRYRPLLAHVNYLGEEDLSLLARSGATVVWCPRSHLFFGHAAHRWREMLARGVNVCVGTDSLASNQSLSILDELRCVRRLAPDCSPDLILEMGTSRGAKGLRLGEGIGSLRVGKHADFVTIPWDSAGAADPLGNLFDSNHPVDKVWISGEAVSGPHPGARPEPAA